MALSLCMRYSVSVISRVSMMRLRARVAASSACDGVSSVRSSVLSCAMVVIADSKCYVVAKVVIFISLL